MQNSQHRSPSSTRALAEWIQRSPDDAHPDTVSAAATPDTAHPKHTAFWSVDKEGLP